MCGLCGILGPVSSADLGSLDSMAHSLDHRGPDDFGTWTGEFRSGDVDYAIGLGHTRLAVLDLSALGHQPMFADGGSLAVAYNGEIYNFRELREELVDHGCAFRSDCDTEVLLEAYRVWGVGAFPRLNGMFAFVLWDARRRRLILVRDRLGIKPLYYRSDGALLTFGSEIRALRCHPAFLAEIDRAALGCYLRSGFTAGEQTIYADTKRVLPGEYVAWQGGRLSRHRYWSLVDSSQDPPSTTYEAAVDRLEALLGDAVELRMIADVPLGAFLSGGVDSSTVVALMQERARSPVRTFSIGFDEPRYDEAPFARSVAKHLGTEHTELYVTRDDARAVAHELPELYDEPFADASAIPSVLLSRLTRADLTVALSGDGGDELFGGYKHYQKLQRLLPFFRIPAQLRSLLARLAPLSPVASVRNGLSHLRSSDECALAASLVSHFGRDDIRASCGEGGARIPDVYREAFEGAPVSDSVRRSMHADARCYLPDDILTKLDRSTMSVALEARVPLLDHRVVRFALSLPLRFAWRAGLSKAPLREVLYRRVPRRLIERPKQGFAIPIETLLERELRNWEEYYLAPGRLAEEGNFDPRSIERLIASTRGGPGKERLWFLLAFERWFACTHRGERVR